MEDFAYYIFALIMIVVGFFVVKKVAGCIIKTVIFIAFAAALAAVYYLYFK